MSRFVALATVGDPGAADVIVEALTSRGIESQMLRVLPDHPYQPAVLESWRVLVPEERFEEANGALEALQLDAEHELPAQSQGQSSAPAEDHVDDLASNREKRTGRRVSGAALALSFLFPFPITCFCVRAPVPGVAFLGAFIGALVKLSSFKRETAPLELLWLLAAAKAGDLLVALAIATLRRRKDT
jgi:hypothetical protein